MSGEGETAGRLLWEPSEERVERAAVTDFARAQGIEGEYGELWEWSVADVERFWDAIWTYFDIDGERGETVLSSHEMPGAEWFPGAEVSYLSLIHI